MGFINFGYFQTQQILPPLILIAFILVSFQVIDKLLVFLKLQAHYGQEYTKEGLIKNVNAFISTFQKLSEELLDYQKLRDGTHESERKIDLRELETKKEQLVDDIESQRAVTK